MSSSRSPLRLSPWPKKSKRFGVWLAVLGWAITLGASAQGTSPAELAAQALNAPNVRAVVNARTAVAKPSKPIVNEHEVQLGAIRQAILEATLDRPTRVLSSAWVDEKGALHESAHFHSEAQVRGVRVLSYIQDDTPQTRVSAEVLPWGWKPTGAEKACTAPPRAWRLPLMVHLHTPDGLSGTQHFATHTLLNQAHGALMHSMQNSQRWRTHSLTGSEDSTYHRALMGHEEVPSGWTAEIRLQPHNRPSQTSWAQQLGIGQAEPTWQWTLTLTLGQRHQPHDRVEPKWQVEQVISVSPAAMVNNPSAWARQMQAYLQQGMRHWVAQLDKLTECEPVQFHVRRQGGNALQLQAGQGSGLRPGDRVLLMNPSHVPSRMLEAGAAQHLALAEVVRVGLHRTELQQLAGPALASQGPWMALPL
jgi:hypothetical protein